jgi:hypothetical protein
MRGKQHASEPLDHCDPEVCALAKKGECLGESCEHFPKKDEKEKKS